MLQLFISQYWHLLTMIYLVSYIEQILIQCSFFVRICLQHIMAFISNQKD